MLFGICLLSFNIFKQQRRLTYYCLKQQLKVYCLKHSYYDFEILLIQNYCVAYIPFAILTLGSAEYVC